MRLHGFTLVEVLLAVALSGLLFLAANSLLFTYSQISMNQREVNKLAKHAQNLQTFLEVTLQSAKNYQDQRSQLARLLLMQTEVILDLFQRRLQFREKAPAHQSTKAVTWEKPKSFH